MKPQIIDRYVYVKGKKISEVDNKTVLNGTEKVPLAQNDMNYSTTVDTISNYVDSVHDYLTTEDYNDLKGQVDSERTNRQEADNELNQSVQDTKSELHSTISNVESELLNKVSDLQEQIDNINNTGIANGVTLDTVQTITGEKTFTTVPKSTASATSANDLTNKNYVDTAISEALGDTISNVVTTNTAQEISGLKTFKTLPKGDGTPTAVNDLVTKQYVDNAVANADIDLDGYATQAWVNEQGFAKTSDLPEGLEIGETTGTAFDGARGKAVEDKTTPFNVSHLLMEIVGSRDVSNSFKAVYNPNYTRINYPFYSFKTGLVSMEGFGIDAATSTYAGVMSAADKRKLDSLSAESDVYVIDYITKNDGTVTQEQYNEIRSAIESNKIIVIKIGVDNLFTISYDLGSDYVQLLVSANSSYWLHKSISVVSQTYTIKSDYTYSVKTDSINLRFNDDGTKFLSNDGTYRTITQPDLSNYLTTADKTELETEIEDLNERVSSSKVTTNDISGGLNITSITQSAYDKLQDKDANTLYIITE